jgi:hypothetical protein
MNRRARLKAAAVVSAAAACPLPLFSQSRTEVNWRSTVLRYLESLGRADGGYGWEGQEHSHLTPTFYVIGCYRLLGETPPRASRLAEFVHTHHPSVLKKLEQERRVFDFQQVQALVWLGEDASALKVQRAECARDVYYIGYDVRRTFTDDPAEGQHSRLLWTCISADHLLECYDNVRRNYNRIDGKFRSSSVAALADYFQIELVGAGHIHTFTEADLPDRNQWHNMLSDDRCRPRFIQYSLLDHQ